MAATLTVTLWPGAASTGLAVVDRSTGEVVYERQVEVGEEFRLAHRHSVTRRMVYETFSVLDADTVAVEELWFDAFGANLPAGPEEVEGEQTRFVSEDGAYRVIHDSRPLGVLAVRAGSPEVNHVIRFEDGEELRLLDAARAGAHIDVVVGGDFAPAGEQVGR